MATVPGARIREAGPGSPSRALSWRISSDNQGGRQWAGPIPLNLFPVLSSRNSFNNLLNAYCVPAVISGSGGTCPCSPDSLSGSIVCVSVCRGRGEVFLFSSPPSFKGASLVAETVKNLLTNAGDLGSIPGSGRSPGEGNGNPLQYSCLENPMDRGACSFTVHGAAKSWTRLSD